MCGESSGLLLPNSVSVVPTTRICNGIVTQQYVLKCIISTTAHVHIFCVHYEFYYEEMYLLSLSTYTHDKTVLWMNRFS